MRLDDDSGEKSLSFVFDNSLSYPSSKQVDFKYTLLTDNDTYLEKTDFGLGLSYQE